MDAEHTATFESAAIGDDPAGSGQLRLHIGERRHHSEWQLDDETRAVGRRGIAQARAALRSARALHLDEPGADRGGRGEASSRRPTAA